MRLRSHCVVRRGSRGRRAARPPVGRILRHGAGGRADADSRARRRGPSARARGSDRRARARSGHRGDRRDRQRGHGDGAGARAQARRDAARSADARAGRPACPGALADRAARRPRAGDDGRRESGKPDRRGRGGRGGLPVEAHDGRGAAPKRSSRRSAAARSSRPRSRDTCCASSRALRAARAQPCGRCWPRASSKSCVSSQTG
jgi:hypothetical protein